eukprot:scaffold8084_cov144-Skeletonema_menzelii.AAC.3
MRQPARAENRKVVKNSVNLLLQTPKALTPSRFDPKDEVNVDLFYNVLADFLSSRLAPSKSTEKVLRTGR